MHISKKGQAHTKVLIILKLMIYRDRLIYRADVDTLYCVGSALKQHRLTFQV